MITEKERNVETNKLMHHTLAAVNNFKHRLDSLVSIDNIRAVKKTARCKSNLICKPMERIQVIFVFFVVHLVFVLFICRKIDSMN